MTFRPRIRTILLVVNVIILLLPLASIAALRIYDNELIRQSEAALIAQGAVVQSAYRHEVQRGLRDQQIAFEVYGLPREVLWPASSNEEFGKLPPRLDLTVDRIRPPAEAALEAKVKPDQYAAAAGASLNPVLEEAVALTQATVTVVDWRGTAVATSGGGRDKSFATREEVGRALTGEAVSLLRERRSSGSVSWVEELIRRGRVSVFVALPVVWESRVYGAVVLSRPPVSLPRALYESSGLFAGLFGVLILGVSMITLLTTLTIQRPIRQLIRQARRIAAANHGATRPIANPGTVEFEELSDAIATMARTLEKRNEYIRTFARDVSHEFKTPLASIKGTVELLEDHFDTMTAEKRTQFLEMISSDTHRLDRLVRRLLELARADVFNPTTEWVDAAELLPGLAERARVELDLDLGSANSLMVAMAPEAFESVFSNLFDNARQHGGVHVSVEVIDESPDLYKVLVSDDGPGISAANREKVFQSFFTTAREEGGTGLGLPIVRSLLERHGGKIQITPAESRGASFLLTLPGVGPRHD